LDSDLVLSPWNPLPLRSLIVSIVRKRRGVILDDELKRALKKELGSEPSEGELNRALMQLEINGLVHVSQITKTKRRIEVIEEGTEFLAVDED
jgi:DNA-binding PadR family transcriptional regulator